MIWKATVSKLTRNSERKTLLQFLCHSDQDGKMIFIVILAVVCPAVAAVVCRFVACPLLLVQLLAILSSSDSVLGTLRQGLMLPKDCPYLKTITEQLEENTVSRRSKKRRREDDYDLTKRLLSCSLSYLFIMVEIHHH